MSELIPDYEDVNPFREKIAALTAENLRLREALEAIAGMRFDTESGGWMCDIAEKALNQPPSPAKT